MSIAVLQQFLIKCRKKSGFQLLCFGFVFAMVQMRLAEYLVLLVVSNRFRFGFATLSWRLILLEDQWLKII